MKEFIILIITLCIIGVAAYQNYTEQLEKESDVLLHENINELDNDEYIKLFNNGISMKDLGDLIPAYTEVAKRLGILHEQTNISSVNITKISTFKKKNK